jgi:protein SCO1/2
MPDSIRRKLLAASAILPFAGASTVLGKYAGACEAPKAAAAATPKFAPPESGREIMRRRFFPNVTLVTHEGRKVRFYDDLLKDKIVVLNFMYATCTGICPTITSHLVRARKILQERGLARQVSFYSITLKPQEDTPTRLKEYAEMHGAGPGWLFLTGNPDDIELLRQRLGYADINPEVDKDTSRHNGMIRIGNEPQSLWSACQGSAQPEWIAEEISFVVPKKPGVLTNKT